MSCWDSDGVFSILSILNPMAHVMANGEGNLIIFNHYIIARPPHSHKYDCSGMEKGKNLAVNVYCYWEASGGPHPTPSPMFLASTLSVA